ncbi:MAG TPA: flagellar biosynthesis protein FlhB [Spirochaetota bacterium]|nr:flagellar biosynthesis protein FlhB [Spirochaetota bacterium]HPJ33863.1 flagellar biosynthesis protein FlhB [Spirochaetota bacterium]
MTEFLEKYYLGGEDFSGEFRLDLQLFAAEDEGRTEEPTEKKIREAREKGQVAKTQEYPQAVVVLAGCLIIFVFSSWIYDSLAEITRFYFSSFSRLSLSERNIKLELLKLILVSGKLLLPVFIAANIGAIIAEITQVGFQVSTHPLKLDWSKMKLDPATMIKKIFFSRQVGVNLVKSILKILVIGVVSYLIIASDFEEILKTPNISISLALKNVTFMGLKIIIWSAILLLIISVPDYFFQKLEFMESLKMTKQEIKEEFKETMGDPHVRARMREMQREIVMRNMIREVPKADVVVTNPTHFAVALKYDRLVMEAPTVIAKGVDSMALKIREVARENSVEIIENRPLAQEMYHRLEVGDVIPEDLFRAVSFIYAELYKREQRVKQAI